MLRFVWGPLPANTKQGVKLATHVILTFALPAGALAAFAAGDLELFLEAIWVVVTSTAVWVALLYYRTKDWRVVAADSVEGNTPTPRLEATRHRKPPSLALGLWRHPLTIAAIGLAVVVMVYFVVSPYQNCLRTDYNAAQCFQVTSW